MLTQLGYIVLCVHVLRAVNSCDVSSKEQQLGEAECGEEAT